MSLVQGRNVLLKVQKNGVFQSIACNTQCSLETSVGSIRTTFRGSGAKEGYLPTTVNKILNGNGPIYLDQNLTAIDIQNIADNRELISWQFDVEDNSSNVASFSGYGFFTSVKLTGDVNNPSDCAYTIQVTGATETTIGPGTGPANNIDVYLYIATGGETTISNSVLIGTTVIDVERNGVGLVVKTTSATSANEVQFTSGTGTLTFGYALGQGEYIQVIYTS